MVAFYNQGDQAIHSGGDHFIPQEQYRLGPYDQKNLSYESSQPQSSGITNTNAFTNSGGGFNASGNAFGYGTAINPVAYGQYGAPGYEGGLSGDVQQYGTGRQFEDPSASPTGETYSYKKELPAWARVAAGFIPFGNTALNFVQNKMNQNRGTLSGYKMGGLNEIEQGAYNQLAGQGLLFEGPAGIKTATGKNYGAKGYFEGQQSIWDQNYAGKKEEDIEAELQAYADRHKQSDWKNTFKAKKYYEAKAMRNKYEEIKQKEIKDYNFLQASKINPNILSPNNPLIGKIDHTGGGDGHGSITRDPGSKVEGAPTHSTRDDLMASGGIVGLAQGGRIGFKDGAQFDTSLGGGDISPGTSVDYSPGQGHRDGPSVNNNVVAPKTNYIDIKPDLVREDPYVNLNLKTPLDIAKLQATIGYKNIFDNDDLSVEGDLTTKLGKFNTTTDFTETGIGDTDVNWNNFSATIDPNKNIKNIGYNNSWNGINYGINYGDGNTMFNIGTTFKNGGLARLL